MFGLQSRNECRVRYSNEKVRIGAVNGSKALRVTGALEKALACRGLLHYGCIGTALDGAFEEGPWSCSLLDNPSIWNTINFT